MKSYLCYDQLIERKQEFYFLHFQKETLTEQQKGCNIRRTLVLITRTGDKYMKNGEKKILSEKVADMLRTKIINGELQAGRQQDY